MKLSGTKFQEGTRRWGYLLWLVGSIVFILQGCVPQAQNPDLGIKAAEGAATVEEKWGIRPESVMLSAAGHMIDFRYRVVDPEKAVKILGEPKLQTYMLDQASGVKLGVPSSPKVGSLRQTTMTPEADRLYFCIFTNSNNLVKSGSLVTVVMGDMKAADLVVQ